MLHGQVPSGSAKLLPSAPRGAGLISILEALQTGVRVEDEDEDEGEGEDENKDEGEDEDENGGGGEG